MATTKELLALLLGAVPAEDKMRLLKYLRDLRDSEDNSAPRASCREKAE